MHRKHFCSWHSMWSICTPGAWIVIRCGSAGRVHGRQSAPLSHQHVFANTFLCQEHLFSTQFIVRLIPTRHSGIVSSNFTSGKTPRMAPHSQLRGRSLVTCALLTPHAHLRHDTDHTRLNLCFH